MDQTNGHSVFYWNPQDFLDDNLGGNYAVLLLNQPVAEIKYMTRIWKNASLRVAVDGGANILYQIEKQCEEILQYPPHFISGDFDSAKPEVLEHYEKKGVKIIPTPCQDRTDLTKALILTQQTCKQLNSQLKAIFVLVRPGGRFDHQMGNIESLFLSREFTNIPIYICCEECITWLLLPGGLNRIKIGTNRNGGYCGLIPIGQPCDHVTTTGLRWNLEDGKLAFGHLVSTSNQLMDVDEVTVVTDNPVLWTMSLTDSSPVTNGVGHTS